MSVDDLINSVVDLVPDREFYGDRLNNAVFRQMRHDLDSLIFRRNNNHDKKVKILIDLIQRHRLLKYLDREG